VIRSGIRRVFALALRRRDQWERDVEDEIKLHLALRAEQLAAEGRSPDDAYAEAVRRFGPLTESRARLVEAARQRERNMARTEFFADLRQDLRFALRTLGRQRGWTTVTILTLALGIGATTAVFSVVSPLMLHPLSYPHSDRIVFVNQQPAGGNNTGIRVTITPSMPVVRAWQQSAHSFEQIEAYAMSPMSMETTSGEPSVIQTVSVFPTFTSFAGTQPLRGRMFTDAEIHAREKVALLGEGFWRERLGGDPSVIGKRITLDDTAFTVIGIMPASVDAPGIHAQPSDVWLPLDIHNDRRGGQVVARLRPHVDIGTARAELDSIYKRDPSHGAAMFQFRTVITTPGEQVSFRESLIVLVVAVALVLLVACANVAHLLIARATTRRREMAIRAALGAARGRQMRQLITESLLLAFGGAIAGVLLGWIGLHLLVAMRPRELDALHAAHLDGTTLAIAIGVMIVSGIVFGLIGTVQSARASTHDTLKAGSVALNGTSRARGRAVLIVSEMALSAALLVMATLLIRSVVNMQRADLGFQPQGLYSVTLHPLKGDITSKPRAAAILRDLTTRLASMPGVRGVAVASYPPGTRAFLIGRLEVEGETPSGSTTAFIDDGEVAPNYFRVMRIPLVAGTLFTDTTSKSREVLINAGFARSHWGRTSAIGHRVRVGPYVDAQWYTIVGVVSDVKTSGPGTESNAPMLYFPWTEPADSTAPPELPALLVRADPGTPMQALVTTASREAGVRGTPQVDDVVHTIRGAIAGGRYIMLLLTIFALMAVVLASVGLYGVMAYTVSQRTREIGVRIALGAPRSTIARGILVRGVLLAIVGAVIGLAGAHWATRLVQSSLYGVTRSDPWSLAAGVVVLAAAALLACIVPTRRALAVDPMTAIRAD